MSEYKAKSIKLVSHIELSKTQAIRIELVDTDPDSNNSKLVVSLQKYWRKSDLESWKAGKGFHLDYETSQQVVDGLESANLILDRVPEKKPANGWDELVQ